VPDYGVDDQRYDETIRVNENTAVSLVH
jgi:hypothetical protein